LKFLWRLLAVSDKWGIFGTSQVQIKTNHTTRIILGLLMIFVITALVLHNRLQSLAVKNEAVERQLGAVEERLSNLMIEVAKMNDMKQRIWDQEDGDNEAMEEDEDDFDDERVRRSVPEDDRVFGPTLEGKLVEVTTTRRRLNGNNDNDDNDSGHNLFKTGRSTTNPSIGSSSGFNEQRFPVSNRKRERGNKNSNSTTGAFMKRHARKLPKHVLKLKAKSEARIVQLKLKLEAAKERVNNARAKALQLQAEINNTSRRYDGTSSLSPLAL
jgi:hypothetical protein